MMTAMELSPSAFEMLVADAMDRIPIAFAQLLDNIVVQIREAPTREMIESVGLDPNRHTLFGLYTGVALDRRGEAYGNVLPDVVFLFRRPLLNAARSRAELVRQVQLTLLHEIGHHLGFDDEQMAAWEAAFPGLPQDSTGSST
ncbi:MAG TPA: metallopeptidase family protein [Acidobacteria bacterium]|nr:metallopeptidase family protein [Acidobacteriota bacterium]